MLFRYIPERQGPFLPRHLLALLLGLIRDTNSVPEPPRYSPSDLAELREAAVLCPLLAAQPCDSEASGAGLAQGTMGSTGHHHPTGGNSAGQCQQREGERSRADTEG